MPNRSRPEQTSRQTCEFFFDQVETAENERAVYLAEGEPRKAFAIVRKVTQENSKSSQIEN